MQEYERTRLWRESLAPQNDSDDVYREQLKTALRAMRRNAEPIARNIEASLPGYTVHDLPHSDALWETADTVANGHWDRPSTIKLTPAEAFVLGAAFIVHDLGMGLAAYPGGIEELRQNPKWNDAVASRLKKKLERTPKPEEIKNPGEDIERAATQQLLRVLHAERAETLATINFQHAGNTIFLIEDAELRNAYGAVIGRVAHSHWWSVNELTSRLQAKVTGPRFFPRGWNLDPIKLACLIRLADYCHIDDGRAPLAGFVIGQYEGESGKHWVFQNKLNRPEPQTEGSDRLLYTSKNPFNRDEVEAWWLCHDTLQDIDKQLREVDALLADTNKTRFVSRGISSVEAPERLAQYVETTGWRPVDARVKVGNVAGLVRSLGGAQLYGENYRVPLRELIQNACDAVRARRLLENKPETWGDVTVRTGEDEHGHWIEVEDNGVGMSEAVLTGNFLDFGNSFWGSEQMHEELPGLEASGFQPTGRFGIGFFSVFMWGEKVKVITFKKKEGESKNLVLEFNNSLSNRPTFRLAEPDEYLTEFGTCIRIWLDEEVFKEVSTIKTGYRRDNKEIISLAKVCLWLCPAIDANLRVYDSTMKHPIIENVVFASDWMTISPLQLLERLSLNESKVFDSEDEKVEISRRMKLLVGDDGTVIGRACLGEGRYAEVTEDEEGNGYSGVITCGGIRVNCISGFVGILTGTASRASRDKANPLSQEDAYQRWVKEQTNDIMRFNTVFDEVDIADVVRGLGFSSKELSFAYWKNDMVNEDTLRALKDFEEIFIVGMRYNSNFKNYNHSGNFENVIFVKDNYYDYDDKGDIDYQWPYFDLKDSVWLGSFAEHRYSLLGQLVEVIAGIWDTNPIELFHSVNLGGKVKRVIGKKDSKEVTADVLVLLNPGYRR